MNERRYCLSQIANLLFDYFVVNRNAMAVQRPDGNYTTKYTRVTANDVFCMINSNKSFGTYQQLYKSQYLKWICFDFDCKDKEMPDINSLFNLCTLPLNEYLDSKQIHYINEFSGRRGIHTWILFDDYVSKEVAYDICQSICAEVAWTYSSDDFGLDVFPATRTSKGNVVGKQVKLPLSTHRKGGRSYFFTGKYTPYVEDAPFFELQLSILKSLKRNSLADVVNRLHVEYKEIVKYNKTFISDNVEIDAQQVIEVLSETNVFREIFERVLHGEPMMKDWLVLLGTLGKFSDNYRLLIDVFRYCPAFSEEESLKKIEKYEKRYFPASFQYLYDLYDMEMENGISPDETGLQYLIRRLNIPVEIKDWSQNEINLLNDSKYTVVKERRYLFLNDEVPVVSIFHDLKHMTRYETNQIDERISKIKAGEKVNIYPEGYEIYVREESADKKRTMVSLSAYERVLTSHLALNAFYNLNREIKSYSYNPNYISGEEMFFHWYTSWGNYLSQIRKFIETELYEEMHVIAMDVRHFYDSVDFLGVHQLLKEFLSAEENNEFLALISYNEKLMIRINGNRMGVPQGPAYARIIAETFLGVLLKQILKKWNNDSEKIVLYRYVDDIVIFHDASIGGQDIYGEIERRFKQYGLDINTDKSKIYGQIGKLTESQKAEIMRADQLQYGLRINDYSYLTENEYVMSKLERILEKKGGFNIEDVSFFFSKFADQRATRQYFNEFSSRIFSSRLGRGSGFQRFYEFIFSNEDILEKCIWNNSFLNVPVNTINFSCLLSIMFLSIENKLISRKLEQLLYIKFIREIDMELIEKGEDQSIVLALSEYIENEDKN